jgi:TIGR03009 family protein
MRSRWLSLTAILLGGALALAQQPVPQVPLPQQPTVDPALDAILNNWEKAMSGINSLWAKVEQVAEDKVLATKTVYAGDAKYQKPNKASLYMKNQDPKKPQDFEQLVCNGQIAYKWEPAQKEIHIHELPKAKPGQVSDDNFVSMLFGMKAAEAKRRYEMKIWEPVPKDPNYNYVLVYPREPQDKAEFSEARLALSKTTSLPRQIWFKAPNGNETTWNFNKLAPNIQLDPREFAQPVPPAGWQLRKVSQESPRVIRQ